MSGTWAPLLLSLFVACALIVNFLFARRRSVTVVVNGREYMLTIRSQSEGAAYEYDHALGTRKRVYRGRDGIQVLDEYLQALPDGTLYWTSSGPSQASCVEIDLFRQLYG